jgi:uncharacterized protein (TIGR02444 family)
VHDATKLGQNPFWQYSLSAWQDETCRKLLLDWQDLGADINLLLFCAYLAREGRVLNCDLLERAGIFHWQQTVVTPLRAARIRLKEQADAQLYAQLKQQELDAERHEQDLLAALALDCETYSSEQLLQTNLNLYLGTALLHTQKEKAQQLIERLGLF